MTTSLLVPWTPGCPHREAAWAHVQGCYAARFPDWQVLTGACDPGPYNRAQAILRAAEAADGDVFLVADADVLPPDHLADAIAATADHGWAVPHLMLHRLDEPSTAAVLAGADPFGLPTAERPYRGHATGTLVAIRRDVLFDVPPDPRFLGWGQEDDAWALALRALIGPEWRGTDPLYHLWHPPQPRLNRRVGTKANELLFQRYRRAHRHQDRMAALIEEARHVAVGAPRP